MSVVNNVTKQMEWNEHNIHEKSWLTKEDTKRVCNEAVSNARN
jgi:hypothetical protein